jgi:hypothetical protein
MKYDVKMRVFSGPKQFQDVTVTVDAASGDEAVDMARKKAKGERVAVNTVMPTPVAEEVAEAPKKKAPKK